MTAFFNPVNIANRGLMHCGQPRISDTLGFNEDSKQASTCSFVYDKLRRAELRRNTWRFATRNAVLRPIDDTFRLLAPPLWQSGTTYFVGSIVSDAANNFWISSIPFNLNQSPGNSSGWDLYTGPMAVPLWVAANTTSYFAGEVVYTTAGAGGANAYISLINGNTDNPGTLAAWIATTTYKPDALVSYLSVTYQSKIDFNLAQTPSASPLDWATGTTYAAAATVNGSDGLIYSSIAGGNLGNDPISTSGFWTNTGVLCPWTRIITRTSGSTNWLMLGAILQPLNFLYPIGVGPATQASTRNIFRLPANYLMVAPQDPKAGSNSPLGGPSGLMYPDWLYSGNYMISGEFGPIVFRFTADMTNVPDFDDMFCEGLGARIGLEVCEELTQSTAKVNSIAAMYGKFMTEARLKNAIEEGAREAADDDFLTCRQ